MIVLNICIELNACFYSHILDTFYTKKRVDYYYYNMYSIGLWCSDSRPPAPIKLSHILLGATI